MDFNAQVRRLRDVHDAVADLPVSPFVECYNEPGQNSGVDFRAVIKATGFVDRRRVLMATGDSDCFNTTDLGGPPDFIVLDYITTHSGRKPDWAAEAGKFGHFLFEGWDADKNNKGWRGAHVPPLDDEPIGCQEGPNPDFGRRDNRSDAFEDAGAGYGVGGGGATFHSESGIQAVVPGPVQTACATSFFGAMDFFPADVPTGRYVHDGFQNHPLESISATPQWAGEVAGRVLGDRAYTVAAVISQDYRATPKAGWHISQTYDNGRGNILALVRS
jgi:hypothetical protein